MFLLNYLLTLSFLRLENSVRAIELSIQSVTTKSKDFVLGKRNEKNIMDY